MPVAGLRFDELGVELAAARGEQIGGASQHLVLEAVHVDLHPGRARQGADADQIVEPEREHLVDGHRLERAPRVVGRLANRVQRRPGADRRAMERLDAGAIEQRQLQRDHCRGEVVGAQVAHERLEGVGGRFERDDRQPPAVQAGREQRHRPGVGADVEEHVAGTERRQPGRERPGPGVAPGTLELRQRLGGKADTRLRLDERLGPERVAQPQPRHQRQRRRVGQHALEERLFRHRPSGTMTMSRSRATSHSSSGITTPDIEEP